MTDLFGLCLGALVISVIICTHNPLPHFMEAVLGALKAQTLPLDEWELILVDNASKPPLSEKFDLSWHPAGRILVEERIGLTHARWSGFQAARADLIVYVDDDNVLEPNFLEESWRIAREYPFLGAWGGQILMRLDKQPEGDENLYAKSQLHVQFTKIKWLNFYRFPSDCPSGAGLVVRRPVLEAYAGKLDREPLRRKLDRTGMGGGCGGDTDIVLTSLELGLGMGQFPSLILHHLTPASRLTREYCLRQSYSLGYSTEILNEVWSIPQLSREQPLLIRLREKYQYWRMPPLARAIYSEKDRGHREARAMLTEFAAETGRKNERSPGANKSR